MPYAIRDSQQAEEEDGPGEHATQGAVETGVHEESEPRGSQCLTFKTNKNVDYNAGNREHAAAEM